MTKKVKIYDREFNIYSNYRTKKFKNGSLPYVGRSVLPQLVHYTSGNTNIKSALRKYVFLSKYTPHQQGMYISLEGEFYRVIYKNNRFELSYHLKLKGY